MQPSLLSSQAENRRIRINQMKINSACRVLDYLSWQRPKIRINRAAAWGWTLEDDGFLENEHKSKQKMCLVKCFILSCLVILSFSSAVPFPSSLSIITLPIQVFLNPSATVHLNSPIILCQQNCVSLSFLSDKTVWYWSAKPLVRSSQSNERSENSLYSFSAAATTSHPHVLLRASLSTLMKKTGGKLLLNISEKCHLFQMDLALGWGVMRSCKATCSRRDYQKNWLKNHPAIYIYSLSIHGVWLGSAHVD